MIDVEKPMVCGRGIIFDRGVRLESESGEAWLKVALGDTGDNYQDAARFTYFVNAETGSPISSLLGTDFAVRNVETNRIKAINICMDIAIREHMGGSAAFVDALIEADLLKED